MQHNLESRIFCSLLLLVTAVVLLIAAAVKRSLWDESNDAAAKSEVTLTQTLLAFIFHMKMFVGCWDFERKWRAGRRYHI